MRFCALALAALAATPATVSAWCAPWNDGGTLQLCHQPGKNDCVGASSDNTCINIVGGPHVSGYASGDYVCTIYSGLGCGGDSQSTVDKAGWRRFNIEPKSFRCPCV
jgi:hypothetical protein